MRALYAARHLSMLQVGERFEHYEVGALMDGRTPDVGVWEVIRVTQGSATCRKVGTKHTTIVAKTEWVRDERTGQKIKRNLEVPKVIEGEFPETRTITISPRAMVRRVTGEGS